MKTGSPSKLLVGLLALNLTMAIQAAPLILVDKGQPVASVWVADDATDAAQDLAAVLGQMTGAEIEIHEATAGKKIPAKTPALIVGQLALKLGLPAPPETRSGDGYRILRKGNHILMAGETDRSTFYATSHFLETLGCRWFFTNPIGTVIPETRTVTVGDLDITESPDFLSRRIWGPNERPTSWARHNRLGGLSMPTGHDWAHVPPAVYAEKHPEYYALRGGERRPGNWVCTANRAVQRIFGESIAGQVKGKGATAVSISPPDGRGYCQCDACRALDDPSYREPSSGSIVISDRYQHFYNAVGKIVLQANPDAILNFYAYADYSRPPRHVTNAPPNLCAWIAPIRYCRLHSLVNPLCGPRMRLRRELAQWHRVVSKVGWREYNYNLAELCVPLSKISIWRDDIPLLRDEGCIGLNIESLFHWHIYGPHTYLIARMAWDADLDVQAVMDDFYERFCGPAAPHVKAYWKRIDKAYRQTDTHVGSFYGVHVVWTPALVKACTADLDAAARAADTDIVRERVAMFRAGLENAVYYLKLREATCAADFVKAKATYDRWIAHMDDIHARRYHRIAEYKRGYAPRFLGKTIEDGYARVTGDNRMIARLPDAWQFRYDPDRMGETNGWFRTDYDDAGWITVRTCSATLAEQGVDEVLQWMWYRTEAELPRLPKDKRIMLWFGEVDGKPSRVFVNGHFVEETRASRRPFDVDVTDLVHEGKNLFAVAIDHTHISELQLGGILKPVIVYSKPVE